MIISNITLPKTISDNIRIVFSEAGPYDPKYLIEKIPLIENNKEIIQIEYIKDLKRSIDKNINVYESIDGASVSYDTLKIISKNDLELYYNNAIENLKKYSDINTNYVSYSYDTYLVDVLKNENNYILKLNISDSKKFTKNILGDEYVFIENIGWIQCQYYKNKKQIFLIIKNENIQLKQNTKIKIIHNVKTKIINYYELINDIEKNPNIINLHYFKNTNINSTLIPIRLEEKNNRIYITINNYIDIKNTKNINFINIKNKEIKKKNIIQYTIINNNPVIIIDNDFDIEFLKNSIIQLGDQYYSIDEEKLLLITHKDIVEKCIGKKLYFIKEKEIRENKYIGNLVLESLDVILMFDDKEVPLILKGKPINNVEVNYILHTENSEYKYGDVEVIIKPIDKYIKIPITYLNENTNTIQIKADIEEDDDGEFFVNINEQTKMYTILKINDVIYIINDKNENICTTNIKNIKYNTNELVISLNNEEKNKIKNSKKTYILVKKYLLDYNKNFKIYIKAYDKLEEMLTNK